MLLYIHVPFCRAKCRYCAFYSRAGADDAALAAWARAIEDDLRLWGQALRSGGMETAPLFFADGSDGTYGRHGVFGKGDLRPRVTSIFFGGGTPSLLSPALLGRILDRAAREFSIDPEAEISMEANPESMTGQKACGFLAAGVNRVSLGVQALDDGLLSAVGRVHSRADALRAYEGLRRAGFENVGLDFIWGLPGESLDSWCAQLQEAAALRPEHLSCYGLTLEEGTPLYAQRHSLCLPEESAQAAMYMRCGEILESHGYRQYEISNYALPGRECRHNLGYWLGADYLGLGPSAVSAMGGRRWSQPADFAAWAAAPREALMPGAPAGMGGLVSAAPVADDRAAEHLPSPLVETEELGFREQAEELVMLRLRTARGLPLDEYRRFTGRDFAADNADFIAALASEGLASIVEDEPGGDGAAATGGLEPTACRGPRFALSRAGMLISNSVIEQCFESIPDAPEK